MTIAIKDKIEVLEKTPHILKELITEIPPDILKRQRIKGKWSIHEHACHLYESQVMMFKRLVVFKEQKKPVFKPYFPGSDEHLIDMDLIDCLGKFENDRKELIDLLKSFNDDDWQNEGQHPEYVIYNPRIFLRHIMMHDHLHMYRIEELWLTCDEYLPKGVQ